MENFIAVPPRQLPLSGNKPWYLPTLSPEHGVLLVMAGALLTGASLAQAWTGETTLACIASFLGLQAEHPLIVQIKQRRQWRWRYITWAASYSVVTVLLIGWLTFYHPILLWVLVGAAAAIAIDIMAVLHRRQKAIATEMVLFLAICMSTLLAYGVTAGTLTVQAVGLWLLNWLFFASAIFTIKLRKVKTSSLKGSLIYHGLAIAVVGLLYTLGWLSLLTALTFLVAALKLLVIICLRGWYCNCRFEYIARFETYFALTYTALACLTVLPATLPPPG
ncbi:MAG: YwiC-like family protein [Cyanobacteria bacterium P01_D01_bin.14]